MLAPWFIDSTAEHNVTKLLTNSVGKYRTVPTVQCTYQVYLAPARSLLGTRCRTVPTVFVIQHWGFGANIEKALLLSLSSTGWQLWFSVRPRL
jgi:hypothetical protein